MSSKKTTNIVEDISVFRQKTREAFNSKAAEQDSAELIGYKSECSRAKNNYTQLFDASKHWIDSLSRLKLRGDLLTNSFENFNEHHIHRGGASLLEAAKIFKDLHKVINDTYVSLSQNFIYPINNMYIHDIKELSLLEDKLNTERLRYEDAKHTVNSKSGNASPNTVIRANATQYNDCIDKYQTHIRELHRKTEVDVYRNFKGLVEELHKYFREGNYIFSGNTNIRVLPIENQVPGTSSPHIKPIGVPIEIEPVSLDKDTDLHNSGRSIPEYRYEVPTHTTTTVTTTTTNIPQANLDGTTVPLKTTEMTTEKVTHYAQPPQDAPYLQKETTKMVETQLDPVTISPPGTKSNITDDLEKLNIAPASSVPLQEQPFQQPPFQPLQEQSFQQPPFQPPPTSNTAYAPVLTELKEVLPNANTYANAENISRFDNPLYQPPKVDQTSVLPEYQPNPTITEVEPPTYQQLRSSTSEKLPMPTYNDPSLATTVPPTYEKSGTIFGQKDASSTTYIPPPSVPSNQDPSL